MSMKVNSVLLTPEELKKQYPLTPQLQKLKEKIDGEIRDIFLGKDDRFVLIVGPCSADNEDSVVEYCHRLRKIADQVQDKIYIIPRVYTNKPRTTGEGYKGMLHQPNPDKESDLYAGLISIRKMHLRIMEETGFMAADEMLYPENYRYLDDVLAYNAVGARSVEDQQ
ncbi:MAG: 3-deoxy-7-phosphoheptulonate synthase, partial [Erysipelotrichaceae bacterium]|nr:3-deoxy-7-phosphoheptulonate synthase [Erysipelotrichaceae bacterium]